jgi:hypothetical protein
VCLIVLIKKPQFRADQGSNMGCSAIRNKVAHSKSCCQILATLDIILGPRACMQAAHSTSASHRLRTPELNIIKAISFCAQYIAEAEVQFKTTPI